MRYITPESQPTVVMADVKQLPGRIKADVHLLCRLGAHAVDRKNREIDRVVALV